LGFVHPVLGEAPGHFVALSHGVTHFNIYKPPTPEETAKYVFCGHGLGGNLRDFAGIAQSLADKGYTVVTYDYYGRGWSRIDSDAEAVVWDEDLYYQQAIGLWTKLGLKDTPFIWVGYSTGGTVGVLLASKQPKLVRCLVLIAPAISPSIARPNSCLQFCALHFFCCCDCGSKAYKRATLTYWYDETSDSARMVKSRVSASIHQYPPYMESIQSTCLHLFSNPSLTRVLKDYKMLSQRVLLIWGRGDTTTPFEHSETLSKLKTSQLVVLDEAKHGVLLERAEEVRAAVINFLNKFEGLPSSSTTFSSPSSAPSASSSSTSSV